MNACTHEKGISGEDRAADFMERSGYTIIQRNYRTKRGEIDIVAVKDDIIVFAEVKSWNTLPISEIEYSVNKRKQRRIIGVSEFFLAEFSRYAGHIVRYDVVFLNNGEITLLENAFSED